MQYKLSYKESQFFTKISKPLTQAQKKWHLFAGVPQLLNNPNKK